MPLVVRATLFDIAERHRYEQALVEARTHAELQQQQLLMQNERLLRSNADLDSFVYAASHDLKQPINNMAGLFAELKRTAIFPDADGPQMVRMFENALNQILSTVAGLAEVVQLQRELDPVVAIEVPLAPVVQEVLSVLRPQIIQLRAQILVDFSAVTSLRIAPPALQSMLYNLLSNALKYAVPGQTPLVRVGTLANGSEAVLYVADNGRGLDLARHGNELFRRFHLDVEGTGTGLYLVNRLAQQAGGKVEVKSTVNVGSTFRIVLPHVQ